MNRQFHPKKIELLAPAGTFEIFQKIIKSGANAVYFGGKSLNMRMHREDYNFTREEMKEAVAMAHSFNKKAYITVNSLLSQKDLKEAEAYLQFLNDIQPDALIIQDFAILELINRLHLNLTLHASVMMNAHNLQTIEALKELGIIRIVASREMDLKTIQNLHLQTDMEFEYFIHGDMCIAHGGQCLYSGILFGKSSNRGLCMKPCRWSFKIKKDGFIFPTEYPMAVKDMCMYEHIPEMMESGIVSFKIEGRMRDAEYLMHLIHCYSDAIDRYMEDPIGYDRKKNIQVIYENRKRDVSTAYAFGKPGLANINSRYEGTGKLYSHGKVFSSPVEEREISKERVNEIKKILMGQSASPKKAILSVKVNSYEQGKVALEEGVDVLYLSGEVFEPDHPFSKKEILHLIRQKKDTKIYLGLPRMMFEDDFSRYRRLFNENALDLDGLLITNLGAIREFRQLGWELIGDYCLNIYNHEAANFYQKQGLSAATLSVEIPLKDAIDTVQKSSIPTEIIVHGSPVVMYMEHDLYENTLVLDPIGYEDNHGADHSILILADEKGYEHPVYRDHRGRNHMTLCKDLCYLPFLKELHAIGIHRFRIEGCHYDLNRFQKIIRIYQEALRDLTRCERLFASLTSVQDRFTLGSFQFDEGGDSS